MKTNKQHIKDPLSCPYCSASMLDYTIPEIGCTPEWGEFAWQKMYCESCHKHWTNNYILIGYTGIK